ncbi:DinB family protein [Bacillus horti]|uniref:Damage-inducible protein DinB n=1 Tax=Caldalkalibacillus horti TaxID=77523 RepID=A0ABT9VYD3_9BACI|nr:DinB family protein [Bacillus horti]MDQ0165991.1 putative damage-inducible protein DinB [Bacillus horti]
MNQTMGRKEILLMSWDAAMDRQGWYPPLAAALESMNAEQAAWRPEGKATNTIWETVRHLIFYKKRLLQQWQGIQPEESESNDATFTVDEQGEEAWEQTVSELISIHREIRDLLAQCSEEDLDRPIPDFPIGGHVLNLFVHDAYHTGQIVSIRKLQGSWPERKDY